MEQENDVKKQEDLERQRKKQQEKRERSERRMEALERRFPFLNAGSALKATCVGFAAGVVLRVVQMLYFFDYDTGFYTDGGFMAWLSLAVILAAGLLGGFMCFVSRRYFGPYVPRKNNVLGVTALLSGAALLASAVLQAADYSNYLKTGMSAYDSADRGVIHMAFLIASFLFGAVQLFAATGFFRGRNSFEKAPLLYLAAVAWGVAYLILVYVFYAKSSSFVENFFAVAGGACTLLCLFYLCKLFAGVEEESAAKRAFVTGIFAVVLTVTYSLANLALLVLGKSYSGEIPAIIQLGSLSVAVYILVFLMTFRRSSIRRPQRNRPQGEETSPPPQSTRPQGRGGGRRFRPD